jgi:hypothetical protein
MARRTRVPESHPDLAHEARVAAFREDLLTVSMRDMIWKHITTGDPVMLEREQYFTLRQRISHRYGIHPSSVVLVGSCRLGFCLKQKGEGPNRSRYRPAGPRSDVDVAVISQDLFDQMWDTTFDLVRRSRDWALDHGRLVSRDLFNGWISPGDFPSYPEIAVMREWKEFFEGLTRDRLCGFRKIEGRLYRSWRRLEAYQEIKVAECKNELLIGR